MDRLSNSKFSKVGNIETQWTFSYEWSLITSISFANIHTTLVTDNDEIALMTYQSIFNNIRRCGNVLCLLRSVS